MRGRLNRMGEDRDARRQSGRGRGSGTVLLLLMAGVVLAPGRQGVAQTPELRGFWADVWGVGFKSQTQINDMVSRAVQGHYNAVFPEVLAYHDNASGSHGAYWNSAIVPKAPDIVGGIDPLAYLVQQAHAQGLQVHCWMIPYRVSYSWPPAGNTTLQAHPEWIMTTRSEINTGPQPIGGEYTLDPGSPEVQEYLVSIVRELIENYDLDGIHWDHIRYEQEDAGYPAYSSYTNSGLARFKRITGYSGTPAIDYGPWNDFRRREITELIRRVRAEIPGIPNARQPIRHSAALITWGNAPATFQGSSAWARFQNWEEWQRLGYLDTGVPMTYYDHDTYPTWYTNWVDKEMGWRYSRQMVVGPGIYINDFADSITQILYARGAGADGVCTYSYRVTNDDGQPTWDWYPYVASHAFTQAAAVPDMPWRDPDTATEGTLWGRVTQASGGGAVDDATVTVTGRDPVQTDGNGYYVVTLLPATSSGTSYAMTVTKTGLPSGSHPAAWVFAGEVSRYDFILGAGAPTIEVAPLSIARTVIRGESLPDDTFTVRNTGSGVLNYAIIDNASWLSVWPRQGNSSGETDTITIHYDVAGLFFGNHTASISVQDAAATNSPQLVTVLVHVEPEGIPGDFDDDDDVDQEDFGHLQACLTGTGLGPPAPGCDDANLDGDNDVDQDDGERFRQCMSEPGIAGDPACLD